ncbi:helix-turn-helix domain-containing protein [Erysipelotrichaceae bacterium OttesenSCG-928-M19]|nr:helix-turn-helix domain-containing protein [Erysipelotrichaceae bacterium OttesenSCG-928-M19]
MRNYQYIKDHLDQQSKSISWLAKEIGVSKGYLSKLINNKVSEPGSIKINAIHQALGIKEHNIEYQRNAFLIDVTLLSVEKYIYVATKCITEQYDVYILFNSKSVNKDVNLKRFYDYLNFSNAKVFLVNETELKKALTKTTYTNMIAFNNEFAFLKDIVITNIEVFNQDVLNLNGIKNKAVLLLSNNNDKLSILLNVLKLKSVYFIDDFAIFKEVNINSNSLIINQLSIIESIYHACQNSRVYIVGNEYLSFQNDNDLSEVKNGLVDINKYLNLFDEIFSIDFMDEDETHKLMTQRNNKILKAVKKNVHHLESDDIAAIAQQILEQVED